MEQFSLLLQPFFYTNIPLFNNTFLASFIINIYIASYSYRLAWWIISIVVGFMIGIILSKFGFGKLKITPSPSSLILISFLPFGMFLVNMYMGYTQGNYKGLLRVFLYNGIAVIIVLLGIYSNPIITMILD